jgi:hypothetical protein
VTSSTAPARPQLTTDRLEMPPWTTAEATAVLDGTGSARWADDFPAEGDRVIAASSTGTPPGSAPTATV